MRNNYLKLKVSKLLKIILVIVTLSNNFSFSLVYGETRIQEYENEYGPYYNSEINNNLSTQTSLENLSGGGSLNKISNYYTWRNGELHRRWGRIL